MVSAADEDFADYLSFADSAGFSDDTASTSPVNHGCFNASVAVGRLLGSKDNNCWIKSFAIDGAKSQSAKCLYVQHSSLVALTILRNVLPIPLMKFIFGIRDLRIQLFLVFLIFTSLKWLISTQSIERVKILLIIMRPCFHLHHVGNYATTGKDCGLMICPPYYDSLSLTP